MSTSHEQSQVLAQPEQSTRLLLDGVKNPIVTQVTRRRPTGMTVEQSLPFLRLQTRVQSETSEHARIESVSIVVYDGIPRLVLDLAFDSEIVEPTVMPAPRKVHAGVVRPRRSDDTAAFERSSEMPVEPRAAVSVVSQPPSERESTLVFETARTDADESIEALAMQMTTAQRTQRELQLAWRKGTVLSVQLSRRAWLHSARFVRWARPRVVVAAAWTVRHLKRGVLAIAARMRKPTSAVKSVSTPAAG